MPFIIVATPFSLLLFGGWGYTTGRETEACCARCRYPTAGLIGHVCPECGSDLRERGTRPAGSRVPVRPSRGGAIACRTILVGCLVAIGLAVSAELGQVVVSRATASARSGGALFDSVRITGRGAAMRQHSYHAAKQRVARAPAAATLRGPRETVRLRVLDARGRVRYDGLEGRVSPADGLSEEHVLRWMEAAGVDVSQERAAIEARAVHMLIWNVVADGADSNESAPGGGLAGLVSVRLIGTCYHRLSGWWLAAVLIPTAGVWMLMVRGVMRWER